MEKVTEMEGSTVSSDGIPINEDMLHRSIERSRNYLLSSQNEKGYWVDELEANVTISAEVIFFMHFTDRLDSERQQKIANYLLYMQREDGSWPLFHGGLCDISSTVESYMALKMAGMPSYREEMVRARNAIRKKRRYKKDTCLHKNISRHVRASILGCLPRHPGGNYFITEWILF